MENQPKITVVHPEPDIIVATKIIDRFLRKNGIKLRYEILIKSDLKDAYGEFNPNDGEHNKITINPFLLSDDPPTKPHGFGFKYDRSLKTVILHEFCHLIDHKYNLIEEYKKNFPKKIILNINSSSNRFEELAECLCLFMTNPYLLRHINKEVYLYWSSLFHPPTRVSKSAFIKCWQGWDEAVKNECRSALKIRATKKNIFFL